MFKDYIKIGCARFNNRNEDINYNYIYKPFFEYESFVIKKNLLGGWEIENKDEKFIKIYNNSIILVDTKLCASENITYIKLDEIIQRKKIQNYLYFIIYKLVKKASFYIELFKNEYLKEKKYKNLNKVQLFLVYNNQPFSDLNDPVKTCLENLIKDNLIEYEFTIQVLCTRSTVGLLNSKFLVEIIQDNDKIIKELKENDSKKNKEIEELKQNYIKKDKEVTILQDKVDKNSKEIQKLKELIQNLQKQINNKNLLDK